MKLVNRFALSVAAVGLLSVCMNMFIISSAKAANTLTLTAGAEKGSYFRWANEAQSMCADVAQITVQPSTGGPENLERLMDNSANIGMVQMDTLMLQASGRDLGNIRVLLTLFPEQLHFIARRDLARESGGYGVGGLKVGKDVTPVNDVSQIGGLMVGAAGGAQDTGQYINGNGPVKFQLVRDAGSSADVIEKVLKGTYQIGLLTGAAPLGLLKDMPVDKKAQLKFLTVPEQISGALRAYSPSRFAYTGFGGAGTVSTPTLQVNSVLVSQNYRKGDKAAALAAFRQCVYANAEDKAGETGSHPAWRSIKPDSTTSNWQMWEEPSGLAPAAPVAAPVQQQPKGKGVKG